MRLMTMPQEEKELRKLQSALLLLQSSTDDRLFREAIAMLMGKQHNVVLCNSLDVSQANEFMRQIAQLTSSTARHIYVYQWRHLLPEVTP